MAKKFYRYPVSEATNDLAIQVEALIREVDQLHKDDIVTKDTLIRRAFRFFVKGTKYEDVNDTEHDDRL
ncbi:hypothetical protein LCGC14_0577120 [marine sediment metagenome]|uniref:Uncharacterized protein n=1 Tax=marine sediment metagenome TaxID=412755 RepID=A0A0F9RHK0_9ZZZZ